MATKKKLLEAAAGNAGGGEALNVEDVFSTYLYTGNGSTQTITNGIDLAGEGGLVWLKARNSPQGHVQVDTERGANKSIFSDLNAQEYDIYNTVTSFNSDGFSVGDFSYANYNGYDFASWTFRKAPKFFDVVTYTGNGTNQTISHNLDAVPGCIIVKRTDTSENWVVYNNASANAQPPENRYMYLNTTDAQGTRTDMWNGTAPTSSSFQVGADETNASGGTFVAYLFAHNDGDGDFGPTGDQDIIKCGSYVGDDLDDGPEINLGFEPQWLLVKNTSTARNWIIVDNMRGIVSSSTANDALLFPNLSNTEDGATSIALTPTGFKCVAGGDNFNGNGHTMIYIAIRRGPMAVPESATEVFAIDDGGSGGFSSGFPVDTVTTKNKDFSNDWRQYDRLRGHTNKLENNTTDAESGLSSGDSFASMDSFAYGLGADHIGYMWRRAPNYFDVVCYTGTGVARTISHNLGVTPEMMWVKSRDVARHWRVYHSALGATKTINLNEANAAFTFSEPWNDTEPTDSVITVTGATANVSNEKYIAYLFASLAGISKVGSYTGNGTSQTINCGFSSGARFVLIKRTDSTGDWYIWDAERGIVSANDPHLSLNTTAAEVTTDDSVDPVSSGFAVNQVAATNINVSSASYIFYAIA